MKAALIVVLTKLLVVTTTAAGVPVYPPHIAAHELGVAGAIDELADQELEAADIGRVPLHQYVALIRHESNGNHAAVSTRGARGAAQLMPMSPWGRGWLAETYGYAAFGVDASEQLNMIWGAYALRAGLDACGGDLVRAYGHYRTRGLCIAGPKGQKTAELAERVRVMLLRAAREVTRG